MTSTFQHVFDTPVFKGTVSLNTGLFIGGEWVAPVEGGKIDVINPTNGKLITQVSGGSKADVDIAVKAAKKVYKESWGLKTPGTVRAKLINKLADLIEQQADEFAALESLDNGKVFAIAQAEVHNIISWLRYYAGWADKVQGKTIETNENKFAYTRREPFGVVGAIIPWNFPLFIAGWKLGPILACGNTVILKPSEVAPLSLLKLAGLFNEAGFPPGVVNIVNGYGSTVGQAIAEHMEIPKVTFTGGAVSGRKVQEAAARSNLKAVTLELGGKNPNIVFDDANLEQAVKWAATGLFAHQGQVCASGTRIFVQEGIYDDFLAAFTQAAKAQQQGIGDPFEPTTLHGPQASRVQFDRVMSYIEAGKKEGATLHTGGARYGDEGFFITPTIFTDCRPGMSIVENEIFGPVGTLIKFKTEEEVIEMANDSTYGLACGVHTRDISRAIRVAHALEAGTAWVNSFLDVEPQLPFGGYKQSGYGRELGEAALDAYTQIKAVHVNIGLQI